MGIKRGSEGELGELIDEANRVYPIYQQQNNQGNLCCPDNHLS